MFRLGAGARCSGTGTLLCTNMNAVPKMNTIKTVQSTGTTSIGIVPVLGTVLIVFALGTAFKLVLKIVPMPEHLV